MSLCIRFRQTAELGIFFQKRLRLKSVELCRNWPQFQAASL